MVLEKQYLTPIRKKSEKFIFLLREILNNPIKVEKIKELIKRKMMLNNINQIVCERFVFSKLETYNETCEKTKIKRPKIIDKTIK